MAHPSSDIISNPRINPFTNMKIDDNKILNEIQGRFKCRNCHRSRKYFCYSCFIPVGDLGRILPNVDIPIKIDIIKHKQEIDGKSTSGHAAVICPDKCRVYNYPDIPDYTIEEGVVLIYPGKDSFTVTQIFRQNIFLDKKENYGFPTGFNMGTLLRTRLEEIESESDNPVDKTCYTYDNMPIKKAVFIDSTWNQSRSIFKDVRISALKQVVLQNRASQFWRHQKGSPRWYLATIEAIHQFLLELHVNAWGINRNYKGLDNLEICQEFYKYIELKDEDTNEDMSKTAAYNGQYDNLLFFFTNMYDLIHKYYDHNELKSYKRPINLKNSKLKMV